MWQSGNPVYHLQFQDTLSISHTGEEECQLEEQVRKEEVSETLPDNNRDPLEDSEENKDSEEIKDSEHIKDSKPIEDSEQIKDCEQITDCEQIKDSEPIEDSKLITDSEPNNYSKPIDVSEPIQDGEHSAVPKDVSSDEADLFYECGSSWEEGKESSKGITTRNKSKLERGQLHSERSLQNSESDSESSGSSSVQCSEGFSSIASGQLDQGQNAHTLSISNHC
jgi:hypothetical protein